jgi:indole-3-glycerol phosphate synthase/phosphoribosylanthranilate isomerase
MRKGWISPSGGSFLVPLRIRLFSSVNQAALPSRGAIAPELDPVEVAKAYSRAGVGSFSVLTEEDYFAGSLKDLMEVKAALPHASVLRKDFLLDETDIEVSYRAGADAVLLIASILDEETLIQLYRRATGLGLDALVEVHSDADVRKIRSVQPSWVGLMPATWRHFR